jgi:hypothetical protein
MHELPLNIACRMYWPLLTLFFFFSSLSLGYDSSRRETPNPHEKGIFIFFCRQTGVDGAPKQCRASADIGAMALILADYVYYMCIIEPDGFGFALMVLNYPKLLVFNQIDLDQPRLNANQNK